MLKQWNSVLKYCLLGSTLLMSSSFILIWAPISVANVTFHPPRIPAPRESTGGASREGNNCLATETETTSATDAVTPLLPSSGIGMTVKERPTILVYIPQTPAKKALFSVQDEQATNLYQTTINLPKKPGVMVIELPGSVPALQTGKNYQWSLAMICSAELEPDSPLVSGWIQRTQVPKSLKNQGNLSPSLKLVAHLASSGVWYDTIFELAKLRQAQPHNSTITATWQQLLESVGLKNISNAPLLNQSTEDSYTLPSN
ncbi:MAG: DUF928 domain-containing protein [Scytonema sp. PMC 1069.18]|nr:DUF928 domain-containing protein [Scytonema sp. PMC 1069.18]MEC4885212.1 DUF928 domain-containing protein [Scytonema sp. PMC 1070.18]